MSRLARPREYAIAPIYMDEANELVRRHHRHHKPLSVGYEYPIGLLRLADSVFVGAAIVGRPSNRHLARDRFTAEVRRLVVQDGVKNGASMLLGAAWRSWRGRGGGPPGHVHAQVRERNEPPRRGLADRGRDARGRDVEPLRASSRRQAPAPSEAPVGG